MVVVAAYDSIKKVGVREGFDRARECAAVTLDTCHVSKGRIRGSGEASGDTGN